MTTLFEPVETEPDMPEWMRGQRAGDFAPLTRLVFPVPMLDPALECPVCCELIDGPECPHDWKAIAAAEQYGSPTIRIDLRERP